MFNSILFLFSFTIVMIVSLLIKKTDYKLNIITWIFIDFILIFCLNSLIVYILGYFRIPATLLTMSLIYILISLIIYIIFLKNDRQKYYLNKKDLIYLLILLIIIILIALIRFGFPFSITYQTIDPAVHFQSAYSFYKESFLLNFVQDKTIFNFVTWRFASYTNLGLIFKFLSPFISENNFYNIYILYDILTLFMTSALFYYLINNEKKGLIKFIGTILFLLGYPLNNLLIGFFYVGHATCIIIAIMLVIRELKNSNILFFSLFLLNAGLVFTYYLFIPFTFLAEFIYFIKTKNMLKKFFFIFVIPLIFGFIYFILPTFSNTSMDLINQTKIDGYFYNDVIGNSLLFFPIISYYLYHKIKEKNVDFECILFISLSILMIVLNVCMLLHLIMPYYVSKYYYILWLICFVILFRTYDDYYKKDRFVFTNYLIFLIFTIIITVTNIESEIINLNSDKYNLTTPNKLFNVYSYNLYLINGPTRIFTAAEITDIKRISNNIDNGFLTNTEPGRILWLINFLQKDKVNCPVNQTYECVANLYNVDINNYINNYNNPNFKDKTYLYFSRSIFWSETYIEDRVKNLLNQIDTNAYDVDYFKFGFMLRK